MHLVLIEWDGAQPPTTYYTALHNLCLRVRGDKEFEPVVRRAGEYNKAVIVQEGAVLVPSESLANQVANLARNEGARSVMVGNVELTDTSEHQLTDAEREVMKRFNETFKKRGRPSIYDMEEKDWVITCPECVHTSVVTARKVMQCPRCGGLRVSARVGYRNTSAKPVNSREWMMTRFMYGDFEIPAYTMDGRISAPMIEDKMDKFILDTMLSQQWVKDTQDWDLLDMVFCARRYYGYKDRQPFRVACCLRMYELGYSQTEVSIFEQEDVYEPIDSAIFYMGEYDKLIRKYYPKGA